MKSFKKELYDKKIDLVISAQIYGGSTGCYDSTPTHQCGENSDTAVVEYDEDGETIMTCTKFDCPDA